MILLPAPLTIMVVVSILSAVSFAAAPAMVKKSVIYRFDPTKSGSVEKYSAGRLRVWRQSISLFTEKPIFGHGHHTIAKLMGIRFGESWVAHNQYLNYLVKFGTIGFIFYVLIFLKVFQAIWNYQKTTPDLLEKKLYIGYITGLLGYTFSMLFVNLGQPHYIFWFYTAVVLRYGQLQEIVPFRNTLL
jgi:O-antigen ligase